MGFSCFRLFLSSCLSVIWLFAIGLNVKSLFIKVCQYWLFFQSTALRYQYTGESCLSYLTIRFWSHGIHKPFRKRLDKTTLIPKKNPATDTKKPHRNPIPCRKLPTITKGRAIDNASTVKENLLRYFETATGTRIISESEIASGGIMSRVRLTMKLSSPDQSSSTA